MLPFDQRHALQTDRLAALAARERSARTAGARALAPLPSDPDSTAATRF
jgi:hypothetical protein